MAIRETDLKRLCTDPASPKGAPRQEFFAPLYLEEVFGLPRARALAQSALGGSELGIDAFHVDVDRRILYLMVVRWASTPEAFKGHLARLAEDGMRMIFGRGEGGSSAPFLTQIRSSLLEDQELVQKVFIRCVFNGDAEEAERSVVLDRLREDIESKKYLVNEYFGRDGVSMVMDFISAPSRRVGLVVHQRQTFKYSVDLAQVIERAGPDGETMQVGFVRLVDLQKMFKDMEQRFFERNIRSGLSDDASPNRSIRRSLQNILEGKESPEVFAFNHNGVTLSAQKLEQQDGIWAIVEPRLLNGAQTVTTFDDFLSGLEGSGKPSAGEVLRELRVLCRIITNTTPEFVTAVTINNNRQNPVMPWNLRANDMIQLELQEKFRREAGLYYERQERMFSNLSEEDLDELEVDQRKALEMLRLARTFLASDGYVDRMSNLKLVFETDSWYEQVYHQGRLNADVRRIVLCYKTQFRLGKVARRIMERGENKYGFIMRGRNLLWALLCQAILNDPALDQYAGSFGDSLTVEADFGEWIAELASTRARLAMAAVLGEPGYSEQAKEGRFEFLRTQAFYKKCMDEAERRWGWTQQRLK